MLHIFNKIIPDSKSIIYSLSILYGINEYQSKKICKNIGINPQITINQLKNNHVNRVIKYINKNLNIEQILKKKNKDRFNDLLEIKINRALRTSQGLPSRGQRTHTNAQTAKKNQKFFFNKNTKNVKRTLKKKINNYDF